MNEFAAAMDPRSVGYRWFVAIKYITFLLLSFNVYLFLEQELISATHAGIAELDLASLVQLFSATLDTAAWVLLLLLFELETAILPDTRLVGATKWSLHGLRWLCGAAIVSAFLGYIGEWEVFRQAASLPEPACDLVTQHWSVLLGFDSFTPLNAANCSALNADAVQISALHQVIASPRIFADAQDLALVDVVNAGAWILVVIALEIEVHVQLKGGLPQRLQWGLTATKIMLYLVLAAAAIYWGFEGDFLDFWDAALWLFAFVFIELNVFEWQREIDQHTQLE